MSADIDSGVDSPTYDGDVEMNPAAHTSKYSAPTLSPTSTRSGTTGGPQLPSINTDLPGTSLGVTGILSADGLQRQDEVVASLHLLSGPTVTTPSSPVSSLYPDPPSSAVSEASLDDDNSSASGSKRQHIPNAQAPRRSSNNTTPFIKPTVLIDPPSTTHMPTLGSKATPKAGELALPGGPSAPPADAGTTGAYENDADENDSLVNTSLLSTEDIRSFVQRAIDGEDERHFKINQPPKDRPIRIYADGEYRNLTHVRTLTRTLIDSLFLS